MEWDGIWWNCEEVHMSKWEWVIEVQRSRWKEVIMKTSGVGRPMMWNGWVIMRKEKISLRNKRIGAKCNTHDNSTSKTGMQPCLQPGCNHDEGWWWGWWQHDGDEATTMAAMQPWWGDDNKDKGICYVSPLSFSLLDLSFLSLAITLPFHIIGLLTPLAFIIASFHPLLWTSLTHPCLLLCTSSQFHHIPSSSICFVIVPGISES